MAIEEISQNILFLSRRNINLENQDEYLTDVNSEI
jgi:hypothetical protein